MSNLTKSYSIEKGTKSVGEKRKQRGKNKEIGEFRPLTIETPYGLFEGMDGAWYLITHDAEWKIAVVLAHCELPSFTCLRLKPRPLMSGCWWGNFHVATGIPDDEIKSREVGIMSGQSWPRLSLQCHTPLGYTQWLNVGRATSIREDFDESESSELGSDYHCWTIIRADDGRPVVTRLDDGTVKLGGLGAAGRDHVTHIKAKPYRP